MRFISKLSDMVYKLEAFFVAIFVSVIFISLTSGVIFRYFLNKPLLWSDEVAVFSLIWLTFLAGSMGIKRQESAAVTFLVDMLSPRLQKIIISVGLGIAFLFCAYLFYISLQWISSPNILVQKSSAMQLPMMYPYLSVVVGICFISIHFLDIFLKSLKTR